MTQPLGASHICLALFSGKASCEESQRAKFDWLIRATRRSHPSGSFASSSEITSKAIVPHCRDRSDDHFFCRSLLSLVQVITMFARAGVLSLALPFLLGQAKGQFTQGGSSLDLDVNNQGKQPAPG